MEKKIYHAPRVQVFASMRDLFSFRLLQKRQKRTGRYVFYTAPKITINSSIEEKNREVVSMIANQQSKDAMNAFIVATLWSTIHFKGHAPHRVWEQMDDYANGMVETILSYELSKYITSCLQGKRECTFDSLYNWAIQTGRAFQGKESIGIKEWNKNCSKACRNLWKQLPKSLKRGNKREFVDFVWSTASSNNEDFKQVVKATWEKVKFFGNLKGKWAAQKKQSALEEVAALENWGVYMRSHLLK